MPSGSEPEAGDRVVELDLKGKDVAQQSFGVCV